MADQAWRLWENAHCGSEFCTDNDDLRGPFPTAQGQIEFDVVSGGLRSSRPGPTSRRVYVPDLQRPIGAGTSCRYRYSGPLHTRRMVDRKILSATFLFRSADECASAHM